MGFIRNNTFGKKWIILSLAAVLVAGSVAWGIVNLDNAAVDVVGSDTIGVKGIAIQGLEGATVDATFTWDTGSLGFIVNIDQTLAVREPMNVFMQDNLISTDYKFFHNSSSPDGKKMFLAVNRADGPQGVLTGQFDLYMLDAAELESGNVVVLNSNTIGAPGLSGTMFRSSWSKDGSTIAVATATRLFVIDAGTLQPINGAEGYSGIAGENHDAMFTSDGKYIIMTLRTKPYAPPNDAKMDGALQLYDVNSGMAVGGAVSICNSCHNDASRNSVLCGIDGVVNPDGDGTYSGTVFVAGHGGHIARVTVDIDPAGAEPITAGSDFASDSYLSISMDKHANGSSQYKLHDVRLDGEPATGTLYWSTYNLDANSVLHYGTYDVASKTKTADHTVAPDAAVTSPAIAPDAMPFYCASAQTATAHIPVTMSYPAYFTVIPKGSE